MSTTRGSQMSDGAVVALIGVPLLLAAAAAGWLSC